MKKKYSLWFIPPSEAKELLGQVVSDLSKKYQAPIFEPHITLLGEVVATEEEILAQTKQLATMISPFTATVSEISFSTTYYQAVFARIKSIAPLMEANISAKKIFDLPENVFMPHISLLYGNMDMKAREKIVSEVILPRLSFEVRSLVVTESGADPKEWRHILEVPLV